MIKEVTGDILLSDADAIVHGVAPHDNFHQGLALSLRERWPALYKDFRHYCKTHNPAVGKLWVWQGVGGPKIIQLFTQAAPKDNQSNPGAASLENVNHALKALAKEVQAQGIESLAITRLATGVGELSWSEVKPIVERHLGGLGIPVFIYAKFQAGHKAQEMESSHGRH